MSLFEVLYGRLCNTPVSWSNPVNIISFGPNMLKEMEQQVTQIKQNLKVTQNQQKSYVDQKRTPREFKMGDHVYISLIRKHEKHYVLLLWEEVLADRLQVPLCLEPQKVHNTGVPIWHKLPFLGNSFLA